MLARREVCEEVVYANFPSSLASHCTGRGQGGKVLPRSAVKRQLNVVAILKRRNLGVLARYECKEILLQLVWCIRSFNYTAYAVLAV